MHMKRRQVLTYLGTTGIAAATAASATGCMTGSPRQSATQGDSVDLPVYVPFDGVAFDEAGTENGVQPLAYHYPANPKSMTSEKPGSGGMVTTLIGFDAPIRAVDGNQFWQELNKRVGSDLVFNVAPVADYPSKFSTTVAGGDLPDLVSVRSPLPQLPSLLDKLFEDLSPHLSGDAVKQYPSLANIPARSWRSTIYNGRIYGIPLPRGIMGSIMYARRDILDRHQLTTTVKDANEFIELCKTVTNPSQNRWALGHVDGAMTFFQEMLGAPNRWRQQNGRFTHAYESDETRQAVDALARMWRDGLFHPDSVAAQLPVRNRWFLGGTTVLHCVGYGSWFGFAEVKENPDLRLGAIKPPNYEPGRTARQHLGSGTFTITAFKKAKKTRIEELLRIANWLATPWGTAEHLFRRYGVEGRNYTLQGSDPIRDKNYRAEVEMPAYFTFECPPVTNYLSADPRIPEAIKEFRDYDETMTPNGVKDDSVGLYSDTESTKASSLDKRMTSLVYDVIQGRKTLSEWDSGVTKWKHDGGDTIRREYEAAFTQSQN